MKNSWKSLLKGCFLALALFAALPASTALANVRQTTVGSNNVTIEWDQKYDARHLITKYEVQIGTSTNNMVTYGTYSPNTIKAVIGGLEPGTKKIARVYYYYKPSVSSTEIRKLSDGSCYILTTPSQVTQVTQEDWQFLSKKFKVSWKAEKWADGYQYAIRTAAGKVVASGKTTNPYAYMLENVSNTQLYYTRVRAYATINGKVYYGPWSDKGFNMTQPQVTGAAVANNQLTIKWNRISGCTGYDVYVSTQPHSGYRKVKSVSSSVAGVILKSYRGAAISKNKTYYTYIVAKKNVNGKITYSNQIATKIYCWSSQNKNIIVL